MVNSKRLAVIFITYSIILFGINLFAESDSKGKILSVGMKVPEFTLNTYDTANDKFDKFSLSDTIKSGKWVIIFFYPADFTFVCPTELKDIGDKYPEFEKLGTEIISVSTDTKYSHMAWKNSEILLKNIKFPMGADHNEKVSKMFGVYDNSTGMALRGTFIINPEGTLVSSEVNGYNVGRNAAELVRKLEASIYVFKNPEEVCPAKWNPGSQTLKPNKDLVGKVGESLAK